MGEGRHAYNVLRRKIKFTFFSTKNRAGKMHFGGIIQVGYAVQYRKDSRAPRRRNCQIFARIPREKVVHTQPNTVTLTHSTGCLICSWTRVGLTLIWVLHHLAQPILPPRHNWADSGTLKIQVNLTQSTSRLDTL